MENYVITIARTYGSGGKTVGKMLAKELGINYYDREILRMASDESGINEALFGAADEHLKTSSSLTSILRAAKKSFIGEIIPPDSDDFASNENLFNYQSKVIKDLAAQESCVIIGRCADHVLKEYKNAIRIFCYAPEEKCVRRDMELNGHTEKESIKIIADKNKIRGEYYKYYTGRQWDSATNYDMSINTQSLNYEEILVVVKSFVDIVKNRD